MNLSDKRRELTPREKFSLGLKLENNDYIYYPEKDVKEFIRLLKKWNVTLSDKRNLGEFLDDEAGEKLIK